MNRVKLFLVAASCGLALAGCKDSSTLPPGAGGSAGGGGSANSFPSDNAGANSGFSTMGSDGGEMGAIRDFPNAQPGDVELLGDLVVYFEFDSSEIRSDFNALLGAHGRYLASDSSLSVRLEGHADERGSREYNIGLGERRAQAVRQILMLQGASAAQISTVSYGEERAAVFGSDDEAYSLNRRVEIVYP